MADSGIVNIHGKEYKTVALRVQEFHQETEGRGSIQTELVDNGNYVIVKAAVYDGDKLLATGYAEEERGASNILKTSAIEVCETSAVGRALAFAGLGGTEIASADEVANAITQQGEKELYAKFAQTMQAVLNLYPSIEAIKNGIAENDVSLVYEAWNELSDEEKHSLWVAPSKGGPFTTAERAYLRSDEMTAYRKSLEE